MSRISRAASITRDLVRLDTANPPGNESRCADYLAELLAGSRLEITRHELEPGRDSLLVRLPGTGEAPPLCFTGHLDTVPAGGAPWSTDPWGGEIKDGKIYGRGASDMKSGVAAMADCALRLAESDPGAADLLFIFTAGEETGCLGAEAMARDGLLPQRAAALIVGEPTGGLPVIGHKGALWIKALITGKSAHGSMPDKGVNAISKAARVIAMVEKFFENPPEHPLMGKTTLNIGMISGGTKINMVPDKAVLEMDVRTTPGQNHERIIEDLSEHLGNLAELSPIINAEAVYTEPDHPWTVRALDAVSEVLGTQAEPSFVTYFTDAAALNRAMGGPPTLLLGPGRADMAHQTDECCEISLIDSSCEMYYKIASDWLQKPDSPS